ncbi:MAG TPA: magnesium transporter CorA family protein [Bryobacteraceae bacterium]|nr:magnesium transporter CorA family protein [Bryobacteraceae bacterium]
MEWHNITDLASPQLDQLAERYQLHPLHIEDCRHRNQSAKIEQGEGYLFAVLKVMRLMDDGSLHAADLDVFFGHNFVVTVEEEACPEMRSIIQQVRQTPTAPERPDQVFHRIMDRVVDSYLPILDHFDDSIDALEDEALENPTPDTLARIFQNKRALAILRRVLVNTRDVGGHLQRTESPYIARNMWPFLRDVYDHVARNLDLVEMMRDLLSGTLDVYLSSIANRTNQVMKVLTVMSTIALPALVVSGFYGMNVKGLPAADSAYGVGVVILLMVGCTVLLLYLLKRFRWL